MLTDCLQRHPFLRLLLPLVIGIVCGDWFPCTCSVWGYLTVASFLFLALLFCYRYACRWYGVAVWIFCGGLGFALMSRQLLKTEFAFPDQPSAYRAQLCEHPAVKEHSVQCKVLIEGHRFLLYLPKDSTAVALRRGDGVWVYARFAPPVNSGNPDEFDYARYLRRKGYSGTAVVADGHWRKSGHDVSRSLQQAALDCRDRVVDAYRRAGLKGDGLAVLSALTVGDREALDDGLVETYAATGASHVLALSGLHIGFLYVLLRWLLLPLWRWGRGSKLLGILLAVSCLWAFAFVTGGSSSVVRSVIMFSLLALAELQSEKPLSLNTVAATAFLMLLFRPAWLFDVGFQLSFAAVTAILLLQPRLAACWQPENRFLRGAWGVLTVSAAAQVGTAPLVMLYFSRFPTHFLLTSLWVIPVVSVVLYAAVALLLLAPFPLLQHWLAEAIEALVRVQHAVLRWIEQLPFASVEGIWADVWDVVLIYLFFCAAYRCLHRCTVRNAYQALFALLLAVSYHTAFRVLDAPRRGIVFYNVRGCPAVHCLSDGSHSWLVCADSLPDTSRLRRVLASHWNRLRLSEPQVVTGTYSSPALQKRGRMLFYAGKSICLLHDDGWRNRMSDRPVTVDYLYLSKGYKGGMEELTPLLSIGTVVLDASLSARQRERIIGECVRLGIPYFSLSEKGSVCVWL